MQDESRPTAARPDEAQPDGGAEQTAPNVPVEEWIQHPVSDSADYLDGPSPQYADDLSPDQREEFDAVMRERQKQSAGGAPRSRSKRRRRKK